MEDVKCSLDAKNSFQESVTALYQTLILFLNGEEYGEDLRKELLVSDPDLIEILNKRIKDLTKADHGIIIAGETSSGKSTLINTILGKKNFKVRNRESTSTICKLRNSKTIRIIAERISGETSLTELDCDPETEDGENEIRQILKELTDVTAQSDSKMNNCVDIGLPIPLLTGNTILVDTPGIGGSGEFTPKLMEYLPNAVSFIFVINVGSAGGMQRDRLPVVLKTLDALLKNNEMTCFDPRDVIFVTNKWDTIKSDEDDSSEDETTKTWEFLKTDIKKMWRSVKEENIFKMSLSKISLKDADSSSTEFKNFKDTLKRNIKKTENARVVQHLGFLHNILGNISRGINERLNLVKISEDKQNEMAAKNKAKMERLLLSCNQARFSLEKKITSARENIAERCFNFMSTDNGKNTILNPEGHPPLMTFPFTQKMFRLEVNCRVSMYVKNVLQSEDVLNEFKSIITEIDQFYKEISTELAENEECKMNEIYDDFNESVITDSDTKTTKVVGIVLASAPLWLPLVAVSVAFSPLLIPAVAYLQLSDKKKVVIDNEYENCKLTIRGMISSRLESSYGVFLRKLIEKVFVSDLPKQIQFLETLTQQLLEKRNEILASQDLLYTLKERVASMMSGIAELNNKF
uniref:Transmembrane GTPase fzo-like n=1 Tax=Crassostrea virginica TaxID=6565 RepID=A0A8B8CA45_CRAVI|nr:transmembrane GTPase fzo-like [Crassostrea virginica]